MNVLEPLDSPASDTQDHLKYSAVKIIIIKITQAYGNIKTVEGAVRKTKTSLVTSPLTSHSRYSKVTAARGPYTPFQKRVFFFLRK